MTLLVLALAAISLSGASALSTGKSAVSRKACGKLASATFEDFVKKFNKGYEPGSEEYRKRELLFRERTEHIEEHNCGGKEWEAGLNHLADWTDPELAALRGYRGRKTGQSLLSGNFYSSLNSKPIRHSFPETWSWSHLRAIRDPRDQGQCGSCWAFASEQVLRSHAEIKGWQRNFSVSQIVACTPNPHECGGTGGCQGATVELAFDYALRTGLVEETNLPYPVGGGESSCPTNLRAAPAAEHEGILDVDGSEVHLLSSLANPAAARGRAMGMVGWTKFPENREDQMVRALVEEGPVAIAVAAGRDWNWYSSGIMLPSGCDTHFVISHAVVLFGYGATSRARFWHIKNSWGQDWGEGGNLRLQRLDNEELYCGWDEEPEIGSGCKGGPPKVWACGSCGILYDVAMPHFAPFDAKTTAA